MHIQENFFPGTYRISMYAGCHEYPTLYRLFEVTYCQTVDVRHHIVCERTPG